jgi:hypothetical protein
MKSGAGLPSDTTDFCESMEVVEDKKASGNRLPHRKYIGRYALLFATAGKLRGYCLGAEPLIVFFLAVVM